MGKPCPLLQMPFSAISAMSLRKAIASILARYYIRLTEQFGDRGWEAFIHGIQYYGSQRGRRMAQRAIRDGKPLTYENYCRYGEWVNTEEIKAMGAANRVAL